MPNRYITILCGINFTGLIVLLYLFFGNSSQKVVYIDSVKVINSYQGMAKARTEYQNKVTVWKANIDTLARDVQIQVDRYQSTSKGMSEKEKDLSRQLIQSKQKQLEEYQRAITEKASAEDAASTKKVIDEINAFIKAYGEEKKYSIILAATEQGNIAYAEKYLDITDKVIEGLNKKYGGVTVK